MHYLNCISQWDASPLKNNCVKERLDSPEHLIKCTNVLVGIYIKPILINPFIKGKEKISADVRYREHR